MSSLTKVKVNPDEKKKKRESTMRRRHHVMPFFVVLLHVMLSEASSGSNNSGNRYYRQDYDDNRRRPQRDDRNRDQASRKEPPRKEPYKEEYSSGQSDWQSGRPYEEPYARPYSNSRATDEFSMQKDDSEFFGSQGKKENEPLSSGIPGPPGSRPYDDIPGPPGSRPYDASSSSYTPIHYQFQTPKRPLEAGSKGIDDLPQTFSSMEEESTTRRFPSVSEEDAEGRRRPPEYASPRNDAVTRFMSNKRGRVLLSLSSGTVGMAVGGFVGKSLTNHPRPFMISMFLIMVVCTNMLRNAYGELARALGLALIYALQRTSAIRKRYPTMRHVKSCIGAGPRRNFPPSDNPWSYEPIDVRDVEFQMMQTVIAMAFIGSLCGGNLPLMPTWMGGLMGAALFAFASTLRNARGDLARTMGMRVVALVEEVIDINSELGLLRKAATVGGRVLDKILILDRKHRIKDRLMVAFQWAYDQVSRTASQVQSDMQGGDNVNDDKNDPRRREQEWPRNEEPKPL